MRRPRAAQLLASVLTVAAGAAAMVGCGYALVGTGKGSLPEEVRTVYVETFVNEHLLGRQHGRYPVIYEGAIVGVVALADVKRVNRADWPHVRVVDITDRDLSTVSVDAALPVIQTLPRLTADKPGALLVVKDGHLAGIITRSDVIDVLNQAPFR